MSTVLWFETSVICRPYAKKCEECGGKLDIRGRMMVREKKVNCFRGDDEVSFYHVDCGTKVKAGL